MAENMENYSEEKSAEAIKLFKWLDKMNAKLIKKAKEIAKKKNHKYVTCDDVEEAINEI